MSLDFRATDCGDNFLVIAHRVRLSCVKLDERKMFFKGEEGAEVLFSCSIIATSPGADLLIKVPLQLISKRFENNRAEDEEFLRPRTSIK